MSALAFTLRRTGDLWFASGLQAAWDWAGSFFYGIPRQRDQPAFTGHLLTPSLRGSKWITGGSVGPEASLITLLGSAWRLLLAKERSPSVLYTAHWQRPSVAFQAEETMLANFGGQADERMHTYKPD